MSWSIRRPDRHTTGLLAALAASGVLLASPPSGPTSVPPPAPAAVAWSHARTATVPATLSDGTAYRPAVFLDVGTSVGTAPSSDGRWLRLIRSASDGTVRVLRRVRADADPSFENVTAAGDRLVWAERAGTAPATLWTVDLATAAAPRALTADVGDLPSDDSPHGLTVAEGRVHWVTPDPTDVDVTELRSVALTGGAVSVRAEPGSWQLSRWPWLVTDAGGRRGSTLLRNLETGRELTVRPGAGRRSTTCNPTWCEVVSLAADGTSRVDLMHPDGSGRITVAGDGARPTLGDVAALDRFEVIWQSGPTTDLTGNGQLLAYDLRTRRTVALSPAAATVDCRDGVLWWSNGGSTTTVWHVIDLRTV